MDLSCFLKSIEVPNLTALVISSEDSLLRLRDGSPAQIIRAYSPHRVKADISIYQLKEIPANLDTLANFRRYVENYVNDDRPKDANAFHLSHPVLWRLNNGPWTDLEYTVSFFGLKED